MSRDILTEEARERADREHARSMRRSAVADATTAVVVMAVSVAFPVLTVAAITEMSPAGIAAIAFAVVVGVLGIGAGLVEFATARSRWRRWSR